MAQEKNIKKIIRLGKRSLGITLPAEDVKKLGWREKQKLVVKKGKGCLVVRDWKRKRKSV